MLLQQFQQHLKQNFNNLSPAGSKLLLAVSGGIDSIVMTDLFFRAGFDFTIAHCNFQLRGEESERDEAFVRSLSSKYNKEVLIKRFDTDQYAEHNKCSIQEAARELRYEWFGELMLAPSDVKRQTSSVKRQTSSVNRESANAGGERSAVNGQRLLATAHNADDNIETLLLFLFRGTGIHGLTGISAFDKERKLVRPLLFASREQIEAYAKENNISWVEDSSNATDKYTRNFLRHTIIPAVEAHFSNAKQGLLENIHRMKQAEALYNQAIELHKKKLLEYKGNEVHIPILKLQKTKPLDAVLWEIIKPYNYHSKQTDEVKKLFDAGNSGYVQSSSHRIIKNRGWLIIAPKDTEKAEFIVIEENIKQIEFQNGVLRIEKLPAMSDELLTISSVAQLDAKEVTFPLLLRKWKKGDYFYPLGMSNLPAGRRGKKKLSRFFIDQKLSSTEKEKVWVLEMDKKILWVIGYRIDDRFKITASTKEVLKIKLTATPYRAGQMGN